MAYVYTWDPTAPLITDLVRDGAAEIREQVKGALNERLLSVFTNLTSDPLVHAKVLVAATGKVNLDGLTAGDTYIAESSANNIRITAGGATVLDMQPTLVYPRVDLAVDSTKKIFFDGAGDTYLSEVSANIIQAVAGGVQTLTIQSGLVSALAADFMIAATKKLRIDGSSSGDTYISEALANVLTLAAGSGAASGAVTFETGGTNNMYVANDVVRLGGVAGTGVIILGHSTQSISFYNSGGAGTAKQAVTGAKAGNAALTSLMTKLAAIGLFTDSTT